MIYSSCDMETFHVRLAKNKEGIFRAPPVVCGVCLSQNTHSKSVLAVILRSHPTLYDRQFSRYGKSYHYKAPKNKKNVFWGHSSCLRDIHILNHLYEIKSRGPNFGLKIQFRSSFSLITMSILKLDPLKIPKQLLLSWSFHLLDDHPPYSTGLYVFVQNGNYRRNLQEVFC